MRFGFEDFRLDILGVDISRFHVLGGCWHLSISLGCQHYPLIDIVLSCLNKHEDGNKLCFYGTLEVINNKCTQKKLWNRDVFMSKMVR